jgi:hypothetical protein
MLAGRDAILDYMPDNMSYNPVSHDHSLKRSRSLLVTAAAALALCLVEACAFVAKTVSTGGERPVSRPVVTPAKAPPAEGPRVIVFCLDGAGYP